METRHLVLILAGALAATACSDARAPVAPEPPPESSPVAVVPVVVHVVHQGEPIGTGANLARARIEAQIASLNDDFRRRSGTRGHNEHPVGGDAEIEFELARFDPGGAPTTGIVRIDATAVDNPVPPSHTFDHFAHYAYWDPERYVNIWTMPLPPDARDVVLGMATGPETDLPGAHLLLPGEPFQAEGILINADHFGPSAIQSPYGLGRTLTHEMGHYLGLLHLWGAGDCAANDYLSDTPPVSGPVAGTPASPGTDCSGAPAMFRNYMTFSDDAHVNLFTRDQIARMRTVLDQSPRRRGLSRSPGLPR